MQGVEVVDISVSFIPPLECEELKEIFGITKLPLSYSVIKLEINGISTAEINALRRVATDETIGLSLIFPPSGFDVTQTTETLMLQQFVSKNIKSIRLFRPEAKNNHNLEFKLDVTNTGAVPIGVYSGDLVVVKGTMPYPYFNPNIRIADLHPGNRIVINGIKIGRGLGIHDGIYINAIRTCFTHLDLEQYSDEDQRIEGGCAVDESGYKQSSLMSNPRHHLLTATLQATNADKRLTLSFFIEVCDVINDRLRVILSSLGNYVDSKTSSITYRGIQYTTIQLENGITEGILHIPGETHTIGSILKRLIYEYSSKTNLYVAYMILPHENKLTLTIRHTEDVTKILTTAIDQAITNFEIIKRAIIDKY